MKAEMILKLLEAGYNKNEIDMMEEMEPKIAEVATTETEVETAEEPTAPEVDQSGSNVSEALKTLTDTVSALAKTVEAMQKKNAQQAESEPPKKFTTAEALTDFFGQKKKA